MHTGPRAFWLLMALAATGTEAVSTAAPATTSCRNPGVQPGHYRVEAKMISVSAATAGVMMDGVALGFFSEEKVSQLMQRPGATTLSFPLVEAAELECAHIDRTRDITLPHDPTRAVGVNLDIVPQKVGTDFGFQISIKDVRFQGFQDKGATVPMFHTGRVTTSIPVSAQPSAGYYCINVPTPTKVAAAYDADGRRSAAIADANERELLFVKISRG